MFYDNINDAQHLVIVASRIGPDFSLIPAATWTAVVVFVASSVLSFVYRMIDRKRRIYVERLESTMGILAELRKQMDVYKNGGVEWSHRSLIESEITRNLLIIKVNRHETQDVHDWVSRVSEAIRYDEQWQNVEIYEKCIAQPLLAWVEDEKTLSWFIARNRTDDFPPTPFRGS